MVGWLEAGGVQNYDFLYFSFYCFLMCHIYQFRSHSPNPPVCSMCLKVCEAAGSPAVYEVFGVSILLLGLEISNCQLKLVNTIVGFV